MEQLEVAYPFSLAMTDKEFDAVVCLYHICCVFKPNLNYCELIVLCSFICSVVHNVVVMDDSGTQSDWAKSAEYEFVVRVCTTRILKKCRPTIMFSVTTCSMFV